MEEVDHTLPPNAVTVEGSTPDMEATSFSAEEQESPVTTDTEQEAVSETDSPPLDTVAPTVFQEVGVEEESDGQMGATLYREKPVTVEDM